MMLLGSLFASACMLFGVVAQELDLPNGEHIDMQHFVLHNSAPKVLAKTENLLEHEKEIHDKEALPESTLGKKYKAPNEDTEGIRGGDYAKESSPTTKEESAPLDTEAGVIDSTDNNKNQNRPKPPEHYSIVNEEPPEHNKHSESTTGHSDMERTREGIYKHREKGGEVQEYFDQSLCNLTNVDVQMSDETGEVMDKISNQTGSRVRGKSDGKGGKKTKGCKRGKKVHSKYNSTLGDDDDDDDDGNKDKQAKGKGKGGNSGGWKGSKSTRPSMYPSPTSKGQVPSSTSPVPPAVNAPYSVSGFSIQPSLPTVGRLPSPKSPDVSESKLPSLIPKSARLITPFTLEYEFDSTKTPQRSHYTELADLTAEFVDQSFVNYYGEIDEVGYLTSVMQFFYIRENKVVEFQIKSEFEADMSVPLLAQINNIRQTFFDESGMVEYVQMLGQLDPDNMFHYTTAVSEVGAKAVTDEKPVNKPDQLVNDPEPQSNKTNLVVPLVVVGTTILTAMLALFVYNRRKRHFTVKDEEEAEITHLDEGATQNSDHKSSVQNSFLSSNLTGNSTPTEIRDRNLRSALETDSVAEEDFVNLQFSDDVEGRPLVDDTRIQEMRANSTSV